MLANYGKRMLSLLLALVMVFSAVPVQAFADGAVEDHEHCEVCGQHECICPPVETEHVCDFAAGEVILPTCGAAGYTVYTCSGCGAVENRDATDATGEHSYTAGEPVAATPEAQGYTPYTCAGCGAVENRDFVDYVPVEEQPSEPAHVHEYVAGEPVAATPEAQGYTVYTCACGDSYQGDFTTYVAPQEPQEPEKWERVIPEDWTDEMIEIQEMIDKDVLDYWLFYYGFEMVQEEPFADLIRIWIAQQNEEEPSVEVSEELRAELKAQWEEIHTAIEDVVVNKMTDGERENVFAPLKEVQYLAESYTEAGLLTEEQAKALFIANPVFLAFADLIYEHGVAPSTLDTLNGLTNTGIGLVYSFNHASGCNDKNDCKWSASGTTVIGKVTGTQFSIFGVAYKRTCATTLTITNNMGEEANLTFKYNLANGGSMSGAISGTSGTYGPVKLAAGESISIEVTSQEGLPITTLTITDIALTPIKESIDVAFKTAANGKYTVKPSNGALQTITADTTIGNPDGISYELVAQPDSGYYLVGWVNDENTILSQASTYTLTPAEDAVVKPVFAKDGGEAVFAIGTATGASYSEDYVEYGVTVVAGTSFNYKTVALTHLYENLGAAITAAQSSSSKAVVLMNNGTITGNYTIPSGISLLIPCDDAGTMSTTSPLCKGLVGSPSGSIDAHKTLTMAPGSSITIASGGMMNVNAVLFAIGGSDRGGGSPLGGYGYVQMQGDSAITVQSGGNLYCYGYIDGLRKPSSLTRIRLAVKFTRRYLSAPRT